MYKQWQKHVLYMGHGLSHRGAKGAFAFALPPFSGIFLLLKPYIIVSL